MNETHKHHHKKVTDYELDSYSLLPAEQLVLFCDEILEGDKEELPVITCYTGIHKSKRILTELIGRWANYTMSCCIPLASFTWWSPR